MLSNSPMCDDHLAAMITKDASTQTYYTIRWLVDRDRIAHAYRAYAYFRWMDDTLDEKLSTRSERMAFVERQQVLAANTRHGISSSHPTSEEQMLVDLIGSDREPDSGLYQYIQHMMAVMAFDADRRGRLITQQELSEYTLHLAAAVTEALHFYIGHDQFAPHDTTRYLAVTAAHITHMLRDTMEDIAAGYYNIPCEYLQTHGITPYAITSTAYRDWVRNRVQLARHYFRAGKAYLAQVENRRCRMAGYAYMARFEGVLNAIEREGYQLRPAYDERKTMRGRLNAAWSVLWLMVHNQAPTPSSSPARLYKPPSIGWRF